MKLIEQKCQPIIAGTPPILFNAGKDLAKEIPLWTLEDKSISREFKFKDFKHAMQFVNQVAELAETENHHPDIYISYSRVRLVLSTHKIGELSLNDFILASKIDLLLEQ